MDIPGTNIEALHEAIKSGLAEKFAGVTVDFYARPGEKITTPGILIELDEILADDPDEIGNEQLAATLNFNAYVVFDYKTGKKLGVRTLAAAVLAYVRGQRWGVSVGSASALGAYPDRIEGREDDYEVMRVEFSHEALFGDDVWRLDSVLEDGTPRPVAGQVFSAADTPDGERDEQEEIEQ